MPVPPKDPERRQRAHQGPQPRADLTLLPSKLQAPAPPDGLPERWATEWIEFWRSEISRTVLPESMPALRRLFGYRAELDRLNDANPDPLVPGSQGQMVLNPILRRTGQLEAQIVALEDRFGLTPKARIMLGASLADTARSLEDLNARYRKSDPEAAEGREAPLDLATT